MKDPNTPTGWDEDLKLRLEWLTDEQKEKLLFMLKEDREQREANMFENLKKSVKIDENKEFMWLKWSRIYIDIPAKWKFKGFKFNFFVSNDKLEQKDIDWKIEDQMVSEDQIDSFTKALREYMEEYWVYLSYDNDARERRRQEFEKKCIRSIFSKIYYRNETLTYTTSGIFWRGKKETYDSSFLLKWKKKMITLGPWGYSMSYNMFYFEPFGVSLVSNVGAEKVMLNLEK